MNEATAADVPRLVEMGAEFHAASGIRAPFDPDALAKFLVALIESPAAVVLVTDRGMIGGVLAPAYCAPQWVQAVELFWWASGDGLRLLRGFEKWAEQMGASEVRMTTLAGLERADGVLRKSGYAPVETSYSRVI